MNAIQPDAQERFDRDGFAVIKGLADRGVPVTLEIWEGMTHA
jgi:hypothetical protein